MYLCPTHQGNLRAHGHQKKITSFDQTAVASLTARGRVSASKVLLYHLREEATFEKIEAGVVHILKVQGVLDHRDMHFAGDAS